MSDPIQREDETVCPEDDRNRAGKGLVLAAIIGLGGLSVAVLIVASGLGLAWAVAAYLGFPMLVFGALLLIDAVSSAALARRLLRRPARAGISSLQRPRHV